MNKDLYQAVANISRLFEYQKIISEEDDASLALNYILNVTLKAASQWVSTCLHICIYVVISNYYYLSYIHRFIILFRMTTHFLILLKRTSTKSCWWQKVMQLLLLYIQNLRNIKNVVKLINVNGLKIISSTTHTALFLIVQNNI